MFTGLIEEVGTVSSIREREHSKQLQIVAPRTARKLRVGESVAVNGCCLTLSAHRGDQLTFDLLEETFDRTNLKALQHGSVVNLERPLRADGRFGGHFVQGHVDGVGSIEDFRTDADFPRLTVTFPPALAPYIVTKGSIAVDGISLTVAALGADRFDVMIVPYTMEQTNLRRAQIRDRVNLECDMV